MSKIICDVCGTRYPESAEQCPICGRVRAGGGNTAADDMLMDEEPVRSASRVRGGRFSKSNVRKRNQNVVRYEVPEEKPRSKTRPVQEEDDAYGFADTAPRKKSNVGLNIALVIVIIALLCVTGYIFVEYFMPNILNIQAETLTATEPTDIVTEAPTDEVTEEPTIPCTSLEWADGETSVVLDELGANWLLNVVVAPEDTTDELIYYSLNEDVVTVDSEGCLTAVGEGEAVVIVACGSIELEFDVVCQFEETEDPTGEDAEDPTEETEGPTQPLKDVTLTVNLTDITFNARNQGYTFKCSGLTNDEVTWISEDESIVTVEDGKAISVGRGTTNIIAKYGEQEVTIIVRCDF